MAPVSATFKGIKDLFYETRVLMGRGYTLRRFADEVLGGSVEPVMLSYIEKGKRFPTEALVRKLAEVRGQDSRELLILLWQSRILHSFSRELRRALNGPKTETAPGLEEADLAFLVSRAIAALPDSGQWIPQKRWKEAIKKAAREVGEKRPASLARATITTLTDKNLVEIKGEKVRRLARHYIADSAEEKQSLAIEFCGIFVKGLLEKVIRQEKKTYVRNHYLHIPDKKIVEFHKKLDRAVQKVVEEFATSEKEGKKFLNILMTSTPF
ncbi:MAG TPA: hypothetical protein VLB09_06385 [Nitrospiria bacterium]|nr:hypothetical protein [Nitrospiria bacterium]